SLETGSSNQLMPASPKRAWPSVRACLREYAPLASTNRSASAPAAAAVSARPRPVRPPARASAITIVAESQLSVPSLSGVSVGIEKARMQLLDRQLGAA